jgi:hypothetical protein
MPNLLATIDGLVAGDDLDITRTITNVPAGDSLAKAWLTVKANAADADPGIFQLAITSVNSADGQITDTGTGDQIAALTFHITAARSALLTPGTAYLYDIQVKTTTGGKVFTPEVGTVKPVQGVTVTTT